MTDWTKRRLLDLLGVPESLHLEFKSTRLLETKDKVAGVLTKELSAFANADGGTVIIGLEESTSRGQTVASTLSQGVTPKDVSVAWLNQVIQDNISPSVPELRVHPIAIGDPALGLVSSTQLLAFAIEVPRHQRAVQAKDNVYYQRQEERSVPMKAYQVDDVNNRSSGPELELGLRPRQDQLDRLVPDPPDRSVRLVLEIVARNNSDQVADLGLFHLVVPRPLESSQPEGWEKPSLSPRMRLVLGGKFQREAETHVFSSYFPGNDPALFKSMAWRVVGTISVRFRDQYEDLPHYEPIILVAEAPNMHPRIFESTLVVNHGNGVLVQGVTAGSITLDGVPPQQFLEGL